MTLPRVQVLPLVLGAGLTSAGLGGVARRGGQMKPGQEAAFCHPAPGQAGALLQGPKGRGLLWKGRQGC